MPTVYRKRSNALIHRSIGDECILLNTASGEVHKLNPAATCIWQKMADDTDIDSIASILLSDFEIDTDRSIADAKEFVKELTTLGLLEKLEI